MKRIFRNYLTFTRKERTAILVLLVLIFGLMLAPQFYSPELAPPRDTRLLQKYLDSTQATKDDKLLPVGAETTETEIEKSPGSLFFFDPNTLAPADWLRLGIPEKTVRTILNFRNKGGQFRQPEDLRKIWGLRKTDADRLLPYIRIKVSPEDHYQSRFFLPEREKKKEAKTLAVIDVNTATAAEWESLPGIGTVLANRVIKYREKLGGFTSLEQVKKTYGISDSVFAQIDPWLRLQPGVVSGNRGLDLNKATVGQITAIAGIPESIAKAIVVYRNEYGPFQQITDLKKLVLISDTLFQRLAGSFHVK
jgi:competence protein ComEA